MCIEIVYPDGGAKVIGYARYVMECHLGRRLPEHEHVHHINEDPLDDRLENLKVVDVADHCLIHHPGYISQDFVCPVCQVTFTLNPYQIRQIIIKRSYGSAKTGPYCSKKCSARGRGKAMQIPVKQRYS